MIKKIIYKKKNNFAMTGGRTATAAVVGGHQSYSAAEAADLKVNLTDSFWSSKVITVNL